MTICAYEVEVKVTHKPSMKAELVTRTEHAYSIGDAVTQAAIAVSGEFGPDVELKCIRVGPPTEDVLIAAHSLRSVVHFSIADTDGQVAKSLIKMAPVHRADTPKSDLV